MSRNYDLIQEIERERGLNSVVTESASLKSRETVATRSIDRRWANDEALRLVQQVFLAQSQGAPKVVVVAGINHGCGCSRVAAATAEILSKNARKPVCLVDANFRSPALPEMFGIANHRGLTEAMRQEGPISSFARLVTPDKLWLLSSGTVTSDSPSLLASDELRQRIQELRLEFEFVIIDAPPLTRYSDAMAVAQHSDGLVLVIEAESTRREAASVIAANLRNANIPILAAVLNKRTFPIPERLYSLL